MLKGISRLALIVAAAAGSLLLTGCAHENMAAKSMPKNYYHCVYKNHRTHQAFSANGGSMKHARRQARHECRMAGHTKRCKLSFCQYVH